MHVKYKKKQYLCHKKPLYDEKKSYIWTECLSLRTMMNYGIILAKYGL